MKCKKDVIINCPFPECGGSLLYDKRGFWKCSICETEVWPPDESKIREIESIKRSEEYEKRIREQLYNSIGGRYTEVKSMVPQVDHKKRSSNRSGKKRGGSKRSAPLITERFIVD